MLSLFHLIVIVSLPLNLDVEKDPAFIEFVEIFPDVVSVSTPTKFDNVTDPDAIDVFPS